MSAIANVVHKKPKYLLALEALSRQIVEHYYEDAYFRQVYERSIYVFNRIYKLKVNHVSAPIDYLDDHLTAPKCFWALRAGEGSYFNNDVELPLVGTYRTFQEAVSVADCLYQRILEMGKVETPAHELYIRPRPQMPCNKVITYTLQ